MKRTGFIIILSFLVAWSLAIPESQAGFLSKLIGADKELQAEKDQLSGEVEKLNGELKDAREKITDLEAKVEELRRELEERDAFVKDENKKRILKMREMETENKSLQQRIASVDARKGSGASDKKSDEAQKNKSAGLFHKSQCVKWFGTVYERTHTMSGRIEMVKPDKANPAKPTKYVVRCTESNMPHYWAVGHAYEFEEHYLHACE